jgi:type II secretory pathway component GspD/PulD (secretin)
VTTPKPEIHAIRRQSRLILMKNKLLPILAVSLAASALISQAQTNPPVPVPAQTTTTTTTAAPTNPPPPEPPSLPINGTVTMPGVEAAAPTNAPISTPHGDEVAESLAFDDLPLPDAIRQLATLAGLNIQFDHRLDTWMDPATHTPVPFPTVKEKWKNLTPLQALQALLDKYDWQMKHSPTTPVVIICPKEPNAVEPQIMEVILLGYSEPTNIVAEVQKALSSTVTIIPDNRTHQVIVRTTISEMPNVKKLISQLDSATGQILIEAKIIETTKDISTAKGVNWSGTLQAQHVSFGNGNTAGTVTANTQTGNNLTGSSSTTAQGGRTSTGSPVTSIVNNTQNYVTTTTGLPAQVGGMTVNTANGFSPATAFLNADGVAAVLSFLNSDTDTKSIAFPRTVSLDGKKTSLSVIQNIPIFEQTQSAPAAGASSGLATVLPNYSKVVGDTILNEVGIKLAVTPRIAGISNVLMTVQPEISSVDTKIASDTLNGQTETSPIFDRRVMVTEASVPSGYTLVLGGLDNDIMAKTYTKVPGLGDIPGLGALFRSNSKDHTRDTILIFVTPTILRDSDFQPSSTDFFHSKNEPMPPNADKAWDRGEPYDWTKPKSSVAPVYQP